MARLSDYSVRDRVVLVKREFDNLVKDLFNDPTKLKGLVTERLLTNAQAKAAIRAINALNDSTCVCCRLFASAKLSHNPISTELQPLITIAQNVARAKEY